MTIHFGTNPIAWSNDDLRTLGADISLEQCLREAKEAGYEGIELGHKFPRKSDPLQKILDAHQLRLVSGWYSTNLLVNSLSDEIDAVQDHLKLLKALGCEVLIAAETSGAIHSDQSRSIGERPKLEKAAWRDFTDKMSDFASYVEDSGLRLVYHHHMGTVVESRDDIDRFMEGCAQSVYLLLDSGHATFAGADPVSLAADYGDRVRHVHCKDVRKSVMQKAREEGLSFLDAVVEGVFTVPGDGDIDFVATLQPLAAHGYEGWLVVEAEQDPAKATPLQYARLGLDNLKDFAREAGFSF